VKILIVSGSSGGHIFPALSFIEALKEKPHPPDMLLILPRENILKNTTVVPCPVEYLSIPVFKPGFTLSNLKGLLKLFNAGLETIYISLKFKPDIAVGFGSLICVPVVLSAWFFRVKTVIHEQNVIPGKANKFLAIVCDKVAVSFKETKDYFKEKRKIVYTGNPLRKSIIKIDKKKALDFFGFEEDKFTILIVGGSQGSRRINQEFLKFAASQTVKGQLQVIHLSGEKDYSQLKQDYAGLGIKVKLFSFLDSMEYAYSASELVLSRAGAGTITEIIYFKIPAIIIPYPYAHKHQLANAEILEKYGCAIIIEDSKLNAGSLKQALVPLVDNRNKLESMRRGYDNLFKPHAAKNLADLVMAEEETYV
jgi:UDP-N-acetylglucosamine--N-acetylmuramyl-(pentapeptide) pyrophosphoryl-undecaprenol N-acetylglucosamine transferase